MIVSHFQIKNDTSRKVMQEYVLLATNLSEKSYSFQLGLETRTPSLHQHAMASAEGESWSLYVPLQPFGQSHYRGSYLITIAAHETVRVRLLPFKESLSDAPALQATGYVHWRIPAVSQPWSGLTAQGDKPVKVLLHPYSADWTVATGQRDYHPMTVSTGQAENEIIPDQPLKSILPGIRVADIESLLNEEFPAFRGQLSDERVAVAGLLTALGNVQNEQKRLVGLNRLLAEARLPFEIKRSGGGRSTPQKR